MTNNKDERLLVGQDNIQGSLLPLAGNDSLYWNEPTSYPKKLTKFIPELEAAFIRNNVHNNKDTQTQMAAILGQAAQRVLTDSNRVFKQTVIPYYEHSERRKIRRNF